MLNRREFCVLSAAAAALAASPAFAAANRIVFVHGRQQGGLDAGELKEGWVSSLTTALDKKGSKLPAGVDIRFPYYGDELDRLVAESKLPLVSGITARGDSTDPLLEFQAGLIDEMLQEAQVPDALVDAEYGDNPKQRGPLNWEWVQASLRALDKHTGLGEHVVEQFTRDVYLYLNSDRVRQVINGIVGQEFAGDNTIIVAHSLGTVVTYDLLRAPSSAVTVPLLMTLGSPLGIRSIRNAFRPLKRPQKLGRWINCYDDRDYVALYPLDDTHFALNPAIENYAGVKNNSPGRHSILDYLSNERVADEILAAA
ncbi:hypothetical protein E0H93_28565 [Rhizobium leguminosarum bv. viciae]|uniref:hypothetical protein n=1 Tax=Rhizobium leguminosarum TaxID=384 RepID=UPI00103B158F|nr:hypothetical protein [Rhizobium leguminosarum]TBY27400.1 hypothetical protein E0H55_27290 [Rhizobium leguminosarum bv. viciae]TCA99426.1 hypothetical protein E0H93_28565 [Rhizobium leguminosarum bv. viciae]